MKSGDNLEYRSWLGERQLAHVGTNHGSDALPFQRWHKFKEAFAPELVAQAIKESVRDVQTLIDPFGGSGTSALAAQFLGVRPTTAEINPYLQDVIESKLTTYDVASVRHSLDFVLKAPPVAQSSERWLPRTFVEPGRSGRWIFSIQLWRWIEGKLDAIDRLTNPRDARLARVLLGGVLVPISNVRVSGKGRRYRGGWADREASLQSAENLLAEKFALAISDLEQFGDRPELGFDLVRGDARKGFNSIEGLDLAVFSPPYPNSFDYTDIYNVELWALGYLSDMSTNRSLRANTLTSHVQVERAFGAAPTGSDTLETTLASIGAQRDSLWDKRIPDMIGAYFVDMLEVIDATDKALADNAEIWMVVGNSRYAGIDVDVAAILMELCVERGFQHKRTTEFRTMRRSPQQGGLATLAESVLVLGGRQGNQAG